MDERYDNKSKHLHFPQESLATKDKPDPRLDCRNAANKDKPSKENKNKVLVGEDVNVDEDEDEDKMKRKMSMYGNACTYVNVCM